MRAARLGCDWLLGLQNRDGGWPTFCRGWGTLPFDRSGSDLTAHAIRALRAWNEEFHADADAGRWKSRIDDSLLRAWNYLEKTQRPDGSWLPLWFGNQDREQEDNPIYGTGRVLLSYSACNMHQSEPFRNGHRFLIAQQNQDGGWGGGASVRYAENPVGKFPATSTIEETSIALAGIMSELDTSGSTDSIIRGLEWLCSAIENEYHHTSQPIGFYFARLWYHEKLYPLVFSLSALNKGRSFCQR